MFIYLPGLRWQLSSATIVVSNVVAHRANSIGDLRTSFDFARAYRTEESDDASRAVVLYLRGSDKICER